MKITAFGGQSKVNSIKNDLLKKLTIHTELVRCLESNDGLTYARAWSTTSIQTKDYSSGNFIIKKGTEFIISCPNWCEEIIELYNVPKCTDY
jgi:hypothetical protein